MTYETVIGLEVHVQLLTASKAFCRCPVVPGAPPNSTICPVCLGHPGTLPVLNRRLVDDAILLGLATDCSIREESGFSRKNYFYPDLPKGYQITQFEDPICHDGRLQICLDGVDRQIAITRIHMEEDAGKSIHSEDGETLLDFNRCGTPLLEVVSAPAIRSPREAAAYLRELHRLVTWLGICDGSMEQGSFRCDANVSLRTPGSTALGTRTEIKNVNSFRFVERALESEIRRQSGLLDTGGSVAPATLQYDERRGEVLLMRDKESEQDYRYFPEPDLPPVFVSKGRIENLRGGLPELPRDRERRYTGSFGLRPDEARVLTASRELSDYFERVVDATGAGLALTAAHWVQGEVLHALAEENASPGTLAVTPERLAELLRMIDGDIVSTSAARKVFGEMRLDMRSPKELVDAFDLAQISDTGEIATLVRQVLEEHPEQVEAFRSGKAALFGYFMGRVLERSRGRVNPQRASTVLREMLEGR